MRPLITLCLFGLFIFPSHATNLLDQLRAFNPYWADHAIHLAGKPARTINNDVDYVQAHLAEVLGVLSLAPTSQLSADQLRSRRELTAVLADYARQGRFPINYYRQERIPVFIDEHDTYCAVGYLMRHTGEEAMARRITARNNYAWVREIEEPGLAAWQQASGFSLDELKLIQGAYDFYLENAFLLPDKYEVPQKPEQVVRYFEGRDKDKVWCLGEGAKGDLHGHWVQNYSATLPWIEGWFEHGKRSGRWKEYYKGTDKLCRTEHWRNDKLNGGRTRYDREGRVIETILFRDGRALVKTNIDEERGLRWVRTPIDSATVRTEAFTTEGGLIAAGKERIHNPEALQWFQNIELTALNSFAISAR
ncbi:MAG: toxin-antitoxin system YwqK family antitoxin, partial [Flavobacteriales bacterium]